MAFRFAQLMRSRKIAAPLRRRLNLETVEARLAPAVVGGVVFNDLNGDGLRQNAEPGLHGVTVYLDLNNNGKFDPSNSPATPGEPFAISGSDGKYLIQTSATGSVLVAAVTPTGFKATNQGKTVNLTSSGTIVEGPAFGFQQTSTTVGGVIRGHVFNDADGNGQQSANEAGLGNVMVYLDLNHNGKFDGNAGTPGEPVALSSSTGVYEIKAPTDGTFTVASVAPANFTLTTPASADVAVASGAQVTGPNFGYQQNPPPPPTGGVIRGSVFIDANGDGVRQSTEGGHSGVLVFIDLNNDGKYAAPANPVGTGGEPYFITGNTGGYEFKLGKDGDYQVLELVPQGFTQTAPATNPPVHVQGAATFTGPEFGNQHLPPPPPGGGFILGSVFVDANGDGIRQSNEGGQTGVLVFADLNGDGMFNPANTANLAEPSTRSASNGAYELKVSKDGTYMVLEMPPAGWTQTAPTTPGTVTVAGGATALGPIFGNKPPVVIAPGTVTGIVFHDKNSNHKLDNNEPGILGVRVYDDANNNSKFDNTERFTFSGQLGRYRLELSPGVHHVREIVPTGAVETLAPGPITIVAGQVVPHANFGLAKIGTPINGPGGGGGNRHTTPKSHGYFCQALKGCRFKVVSM